MIEKFWILWQRSLSINSYRVYKTAGSRSSRSYKSTAVLHCEWNSTSNCMSIHTVCQAWLPKTACISGETKKRSPSAAGDRTKVVNQTHKAGWRQSWKREEFTVLKESTGDKSTEGKKKKKKKEVTRRMDVREQPEKRSPSGAVTERETQQEAAKERERGAERKLFWREGGGALSSAGVLQQCTAQAESKVLCSPLQLSRCHLQSGSWTSLQ